MLIAKLITPNQRGTEKVIIKTLTHHKPCLTTIRSFRQLERLVRCRREIRSVDILGYIH